MEDFLPDKKQLLSLLEVKMPFGKYQGRFLIDLPEPYIIWFRQKGFPAGKLGAWLELVYEIKLNGLEAMVRSIRTKT